MRKNLTRFFSLLLAALTAMSVSAAPLATRKMKAPEAETTQLKAADAKVKTKAPAKADRRSRVISPKFRTADTRRASNLFRSAAPGTTMRVKAPYKAATAADAEVPELLGSVTWSDSWGRDEPMTGFYGIPTNASQNFDLKFLGPNANYGGVLIGDVYYVCDVWEIQGWVMSVNYRGYNVESGEEVYDQAHSYHTNTMTYDSTTGTIYAIATIEDDLALVKLSFEENEVVFEPVGAINTNALGLWNSIACDSKGQLWGVFANYVNAGESYECVSSTLYKIDKTTCAATKIGDTGFDCPYASDATFDLKTDRLYWTVCTASDLGLLTEINTSTGAATVVYAFPFNEEVTGLAVAAPAADDKAPAAVTDAQADFENGSLTGTVSFKAPVTLFDGTPATGDLTYTVTANGQEIATGTTAFGAEVSKEVTMTESGSYNFTFTVANSTGSSPKVQLKNVYVGKDTPAAPAVTVVYDAATGVATVSWTAVTGTVNGGFMDASAVTYTVTRYPDETVVAQNTSATTVTDLLPATEGMSKYYYSVVASCDGLSSAAGVSGNILVGTGLVPPFTETFDADDALDLFTVIDANGDGTTWKINNGKASVGYNSSLNMDDWLISPPIRLEGGKLYDVVADLWVEASGYPERFEVKIGKTHTVAGMTTTVLGPTDVTTTSANPYKLSTPVVVDEAGVYYIGIHGISDKDKYNLNFDNFGVTAPRSAEGPAAVSNLTAVADPSGALSVVISFVTPDKTMSGNALTSIDKVELSRNGTVVNTWQNPAPGQSLTFTDKPAEGGDMLYSVAAYNADGAGLVSEVSVAVGFDYPEVPSNVKMVETSTPGEVTITWDAVTTDIKGTPLPASEVSYQVCSSPDGYTLIAVSGKLTETSYTFQAVAPGEQDFVQYVVVASTSKGEGNGRYTPFIPVGTPYTTFSMSSGADLQKYALAMNSAGGASWRTATNETFTDVPEAADGDNYYFIMVGQYIEDSAMLYTGKIDLSATPAPAMVLYNLPLAPDDDNTLTVSVTDVATGESKVIYSKPVNQSGTPLTWNKLTFDLSAYAQKTVQLSVEGVINGYQYFLIDGWKVASMLENDLAIAAVEAPEKVKAGDAFTVDVTVSNEGVKDAGAFTVELYADGKLADTKAVESLAADSRTVVKFDATLSALATAAVPYTAKVVYA
ncbi:MAG: choice-of-anchor J domain-containing protein, partial [Duncaniella sp.]|nr:choice-of-anchor J domain-containing protein [Duncaniella sp.]